MPNLRAIDIESLTETTMLTMDDILVVETSVGTRDIILDTLYNALLTAYIDYYNGTPIPTTPAPTTPAPTTPPTTTPPPGDFFLDTTGLSSISIFDAPTSGYKLSVGSTPTTTQTFPISGILISEIKYCPNRELLRRTNDRQVLQFISADTYTEGDVLDITSIVKMANGPTNILFTLLMDTGTGLIEVPTHTSITSSVSGIRVGVPFSIPPVSGYDNAAILDSSNEIVYPFIHGSGIFINDVNVGQFNTRLINSKDTSIPPQFDELQLFLDANQLTYQDISGNNIATSDDASVARWDDLSTNGNHLIARNIPSTLRTDQFNGSSCVHFSGLSSTGFEFMNVFVGTEYSLYAIVRLPNTSSHDASTIICGTEESLQWRIDRSPFKPRLVNTATTDIGFADSSLVANQWHQIDASFSPVNETVNAIFGKDGADDGTLLVTPDLGESALKTVGWNPVLGGPGGTPYDEYFEGDIVTLLVYYTVHTPEQRGILRRWLQYNFGNL